MMTGLMMVAALTLVQRPETKFFDVQGDAPAKVRLVTTVKESLKSAGADESSRSPLYLNGHIVKYESMTSPADGRREIQTGEVGLKPGDVIAYDGKELPLGLRISEKPLEGAWLRAFQIGYESNERFVDLSGTKLTPARFAVRVKPICGLRGKFGVKAEVLDYWRKRVAFRELEADFEKDLELDLGLDRLDVVELVMNVEEIFGIEIAEEDAEKVRTVGDLIRTVEAKLTEKGQVAA